MNYKVLIVDDDSEIAGTVRAYLEKAHYRAITAHDGTTALKIFREEAPDLIVLDLGLPSIDGLDVAQAIRRDSDTPIIMLTARIEESDRIIGLELGADDYVTKPFSPRELVARVKAVLRRSSGEKTPSAIIKAKNISLDREGHTVTVNGSPLDLTRTEFDLLKTLMENSGRTLTRLQLIEQVLGYSYDGYDRTIDSHIKNLRQKVESDPPNPKHIITVYGIGYRFAGAVNED